MKLFELYQQNTLQGTNNLKQISEAVENKTAAVITVGNTQIKLGINSARYVFGLYETAVANGTSEQFLEGLANLNPTMVMENDNTMRHIVGKFKHEVKNFIAGQELSDDLYHALFDYYSDHGEMPYGVQKARDGDPYEWVHMRFDRDVHDYAGDGNPDIPALPAATMPSMPRQESMYEAKNPWLNLAYDDTPRVGQRKRTSSGEVEYTGGGQIHRSTKRYGGDDPENVKDKDPVGNDGQPAVKRSKGRPSAAIQSSETGEQISDYKLWYHKSKRKHPERKIVGSSSNAIAVIPKGKKYLVVSKWEDGSGILLDTPNEILSVDDLQAFKSAKGRPKKIREWIETLRFVAEDAGTKAGFPGSCAKNKTNEESVAEGQQPGEYSRVLRALNLYYPRLSMEELNTPGYHKVIASKANVPVEYAGKVINDFIKPYDDDEYDDDEQGVHPNDGYESKKK
jgi:hypothetical protein